MSLPDFLTRLTGALDRAEIDYMVVGSVASFFHGVPRTTQDVDLVVSLRPNQVRPLLAEFPEKHFYVSENAARDAARSRRQFNVIDMETGWKADLIVQKSRKFSSVEFLRRQRAELMGVTVWLASAEDTILAKLEWGKASASERQFGDASGIVAVQAERLDLPYLQEWADKLGVREQLARLLA